MLSQTCYCKHFGMYFGCFVSLCFSLVLIAGGPFSHKIRNAYSSMKMRREEKEQF